MFSGFIRHGLTNGEVVVIYKHPEEAKIFGQYTFKDERCRFETVFYYVENEKFEFTSKISENSTNRMKLIKARCRSICYR